MATCVSENRSGHGFLDLDTARMLHDAVSLFIKDEGFRLSTSPAKKALETAEMVLEWSSDSDQNKITWEDLKHLF